jgi:hypothetical protein
MATGSGCSAITQNRRILDAIGVRNPRQRKSETSRPKSERIVCRFHHGRIRSKRMRPICRPERIAHPARRIATVNRGTACGLPLLLPGIVERSTNLPVFAPGIWDHSARRGEVLSSHERSSVPRGNPRRERSWVKAQSPLNPHEDMSRAYLQPGEGEITCPAMQLTHQRPDLPKTRTDADCKARHNSDCDDRHNPRH